MMMMRAIDYPITVVFNSGDTAFIILTPSSTQLSSGPASWPAVPVCGVLCPHYEKPRLFKFPSLL